MALPNRLPIPLRFALLVFLIACGESGTDLQLLDVASLSITNGGATLEAIGASVQLSVEAQDAEGNTLTITGVNWSALDPTVVSVSEGGLVTALANGTTTITASLEGVSGTTTITVGQVAQRVEVTAPTPTVTALGDAGTLVARALDANDNALPSVAAAWSSSEPSVLTVSAEGRVTAESNGASTISATVGTLTGTLGLTVAQQVVSVTVAPAADTLRSASDTRLLTADILDANGFPVSGASGSWSSSDPGVVTVDASGLVSPVADGIAVVTLDVGGVRDDAIFTVSFDDVSTTITIALSNGTIFAQGGVVATATVLNADGVELTGLTLNWTASDPVVNYMSARFDADGRSTATFHTSTTQGTFSVRATTDTGASGSAEFTVAAAPASRGVSIDFETVPSGAPTCRGSTRCPISGEYAPWGIRFRWRDAFATGGRGLPSIEGQAGFKVLGNDRSTAGALTGSHEMTMSVDISTFEFVFREPASLPEATITVYDRNGVEVPGLVHIRRSSSLGSLRVQEVWLHSPVLIGSIKIGPTRGILYMDDLVY